MMEKITHQQASQVDQFDVPRETAFSIDPKKKSMVKRRAGKLLQKELLWIILDFQNR
jgi:hypothetical protein